MGFEKMPEEAMSYEDRYGESPDIFFSGEAFDHVNEVKSYTQLVEVDVRITFNRDKSSSIKSYQVTQDDKDVTSSFTKEEVWRLYEEYCDRE